MPKVAFLIVYISYNCVHTKKDTIEENELYQFMIDELTEYIINNSCSKKFNSICDIENFWKKYDDYLVWEAHYVKNDEWINIKPTNEDILLNIQNLSNSFIDEYETISYDKNNYEDDSTIYTISDESDSTIFTISDESNSTIFTISDESNSTIFTISDVKSDMNYISSVSSSISNISSDDDLIEINWASISNQEIENLLNNIDD